MARWREKSMSERVFEPQLELVIIVFLCDILCIGDDVTKLRKQTGRRNLSQSSVTLYHV